MPQRSIGLVKEKIPYVKTGFGFSHIFRLAASTRQSVNSLFVYYGTKAGLDRAMVNKKKRERFGWIPQKERRSAEVLPFNTPPVNVIADHANSALLEVSTQGDSLQEMCEKVTGEGGRLTIK